MTRSDTRPGRSLERLLAGRPWNVLQLAVGAVASVVGVASLAVRPTWWAVEDIAFGLWLAIPAGRKLTRLRRHRS